MNFNIDVTFKFSSEKEILFLLNTILTTLKHQGVTTMATLQELKDSLTQVAADIAAERVEVQAKLDALAAQIQALLDQIANGGLVTQADLDSLAASVSAISAGIKDISEPLVP